MTSHSISVNLHTEDKQHPSIKNVLYCDMSGKKLNDRITEYVHCKICQQNTITFPLMTFGVNRSYQVQRDSGNLNHTELK